MDFKSIGGFQQGFGEFDSRLFRQNSVKGAYNMQSNRRSPWQDVFAGQVALCTASTSGIGLESAALIAEGGAKCVIVNGRNAESGQRSVEKIKARAPNAVVHFLPGDLTDHQTAQNVCSDALDLAGSIDVLVHAGGAQVSPNLFTRLNPSDYERLICGHFTSILHVTHAIVPSMIANGKGSIVVVASDAGKVATPGESIIGAMKAAAIMFVRTLALEVARSGVRANVVTPSLVTETKSFDRVMAGEFSQKIFEKATERARLGLPTASDVANGVVYLASPLAAKITGQALSVNGGISAA